MTEEVELKYRVGDMAAAERVLAAERLGPFTGAASSARATQLEDRYVDTADGALAASVAQEGLLRVRRPDTIRT